MYRDSFFRKKTSIELGGGVSEKKIKMGPLDSEGIDFSGYCVLTERLNTSN